MKKVMLYSQSFKFVHEGWIPPFNEMPKVLLWGERVFNHIVGQTYVEVFFHALMPYVDPRQNQLFEENSVYTEPIRATITEG